MKTYCFLIFLSTYSIFGFGQKWDKYIYVSPGVSLITPPQNEFYNTSVGGINLFPALGFNIDHNSSKQVTWVVGVELNYVKANMSAKAYDGLYTDYPPYSLLSQFSSGFVSFPLHLRFKTQQRDKNFGYLITGGGLSYSPFGVYHNFLLHNVKDSKDDKEFLKRGIYSLNDGKNLPLSVYLNVGIGANFTLANRPCFIELSYLGDITKWEYKFYNPYFERDESENFVRKMFQLKLGMRMFK